MKGLRVISTRIMCPPSPQPNDNPYLCFANQTFIKKTKYLKKLCSQASESAVKIYLDVCSPPPFFWRGGGGGERREKEFFLSFQINVGT